MPRMPRVHWTSLSFAIVRFTLGSGRKSATWHKKHTQIEPCHVLLWPKTHQSTGMIVPVSLQTPAVALGAVGEPPDLHCVRPCVRRKSGVQAGMHRCSRSGRTYEPLIELLQQQAGLAAGRSWQARLAVWKVGDRRTEVTKMRKTSPGRLLAVARCARSARSGDSLR